MVLFPTKQTPHYQVLTGRESMSLYMGGLQVQLISAWSYFLYTKRNPALLSTLNGKLLFAGLVASAYIFGRTEFDYQNREAMSIKIASHLSTNTLWGATICNFIINFLP